MYNFVTNLLEVPFITIQGHAVTISKLIPVILTFLRIYIYIYIFVLGKKPKVQNDMMNGRGH